MHKFNGELDILIHGGMILTMAPNMEIIPKGCIGIKNGKIVLVEKEDQSVLSFTAREKLDASGSLVMPGLVNTHNHAAMTCFRGLADDLPLMEWLNNHIFPAEARAVNENMVYYGSLLAMAEMLLSGTTTFCDCYFYEHKVVEAAAAIGMRGVAAQGFIDFPTVQIPDPAENLNIAHNFIEKWSNFSPLVTTALICHAPYTCSPATLKNIKMIARKAQVPFITHLAETREEVDDIRKRYGETPVRHLYKLGILDEKTVAVHCVWIDEEEITILADCNTKVSHTPESNMKLAAGIAPVPSMLQQRITVGLGTDGCASNNDLDLFREMDTAAKLHKVSTLDPTVMDAATVLRMATIEGAKVLGLEDTIGSLEDGKRADIIVLGLNKPHLTPMYNPCSHLVYAASGADVSTVIIDGKFVVKDRKIVRVNLKDIIGEVRKIAGGIKEKITTSY